MHDTQTDNKSKKLGKYRFLEVRDMDNGGLEVHDSCKYIESEMLDNREEENHQRKERRERDKGESTCVFGEVEQVRNYRENMAPWGEVLSKENQRRKKLSEEERKWKRDREMRVQALGRTICWRAVKFLAKYMLAKYMICLMMLGRRESISIVHLLCSESK